jgi:nucleotide sugar dehydrogenase
MDIDVPADSVMVSDAHRRISVVGMGYVGLPTALSFLDVGNHVTGIDISAARIEALQNGCVDFPAQDLTRFRAHLAAGGLRLTSNTQAAADSDAVIICVPTPVDQHFLPDLTALRAACAAVVATARAGQLIILTSTAYVGATQDLLVKAVTAAGMRVGGNINVAFCPERIDPGRYEVDRGRLPRVIGGHTGACSAAAAALFGPVSAGTHIVTSCATAEMCKLLENTFRAVNIALVNELSQVCRDLDVDIMEVITGAATKPFGFMAFHPGPGAGGHCIPCDPQYLLWQMRALRRSLPVVEAAMEVIVGRPAQVVDRIREVLGNAGKPARGARILILGVTYKRGVADTRESPALHIIDKLIELGADVCYSDPLVPEIAVADRVLKSYLIDESDAWDLVLTHTLHDDFDMAWLRRQPRVLDATYQLQHLDNRVQL